MLCVALISPLTETAYAQNYPDVDLDGAVLVLATTDQGVTFTVDIDPAGFIFDEFKTHYYPSIPAVTQAVVSAGYGKGYTYPGGSSNSQDFADNGDIGCGKYKISITATRPGYDDVDKVFLLDFTDANWLLPDDEAYGIVCWLEIANDEILIYAENQHRTDGLWLLSRARP